MPAQGINPPLTKERLRGIIRRNGTEKQSFKKHIFGSIKKAIFKENGRQKTGEKKCRLYGGSCRSFCCMRDTACCVLLCFTRRQAGSTIPDRQKRPCRNGPLPTPRFRRNVNIRHAGRGIFRKRGGRNKPSAARYA